MRIAMVHTNSDTLRLFTYLINDLGFNVCCTCQTGNAAIDLCSNDTPDLLLVQLNLPDIKANELIQKIMKTTPTTVIVISHSTKKKHGSVFEAMSAGALDVFSEPSTDQPEQINELKNKILNIKKLNANAIKIDKVRNKIDTQRSPLVAIGASTGGPAALLTILRELPIKTNAIWVIIQHMDNQFSQGMAKWLNEQINIKVEIAIDKQTPVIGHVYIASTNDHLIINKQRQFEYTKEPVDYPYRPSVDVSFESALTHWPNKIIGVLLTGMGRDGANGLLSLYNRGMLTIAQNENSCAVYGMPKAASELDAVKTELDINDIAKKILINIL